MGAKPPSPAFRTGRAELWTAERLSQLTRPELLQLQANAERLAEPELAQRCGAALKDMPARGPASSGALARRKSDPRLVSRAKAFEARGVHLQDPRTSWSAIRKSDGMVVFALWANAVLVRDGECACLLWTPNVEGGRPWSDSAAGRERLEHCKAAAQRGAAEGLLVHGDALEGRLPEDRARSIHGVNPETVIQLRVEAKEGEYWALWGKAAA